MATKLKIINKSIVGNGGATIESIDDSENENARRMEVIYDIVLEDMLAEHEWNFAKVETSLSQDATSPILTDDFTYRFALPSDYLKLVKTDLQPTYDHKIKGKFLYSTSNAVKIEYIKFEDDPTQYSAKFTEALVKRLEAETCYAMTGDRALTQLKWQAAEMALRKAKTVNAHDITPDDAQEDKYLNARY